MILGAGAVGGTIAGLLRCRSGSLRFDGEDMTRVSAHAYCSHGIALVPEGRRKKTFGLTFVFLFMNYAKSHQRGNTCVSN